jgi:transcriptional regulator with XRE-family HTH domain
MNNPLKNKDTAKYVWVCRNRLGLTQQQLADILGTHRYNISKYENGTTAPPGDTILKLSTLIENAKNRAA